MLEEPMTRHDLVLTPESTRPAVASGSHATITREQQFARAKTHRRFQRCLRFPALTSNVDTLTKRKTLLYPLSRVHRM